MQPAVRPAGAVLAERQQGDGVFLCLAAPDYLCPCLVPPSWSMTVASAMAGMEAQPQPAACRGAGDAGLTLRGSLTATTKEVLGPLAPNQEKASEMILH